MASAQLLAEQRAALDSINRLALAEVVDLWRLVDVADAEAAKTLLLAEVPFVIASYGEMAADLSADLYDEIRAEAAAVGRFRARPASPAPTEQVEALVRWSVGPLFSGEPDGQLALSKLAGGTTRLTLAPARQTTIDNTRTDPARPRWARRPSQRACSFCLMLASRGAVYTDAAPYFEAHDYCKCSAVQVYENQDPPEENQRLQREWRDVTRGARSSEQARQAWAEHIAAQRG